MEIAGRSCRDSGHMEYWGSDEDQTRAAKQRDQPELDNVGCLWDSGSDGGWKAEAHAGKSAVVLFACQL